ncbi:hypothetical protein BC826DRAFT_982140 [Russula brevipes]|nr:hypothetical protein BC826DRAFT_982140 [Russula brevipes]
MFARRAARLTTSRSFSPAQGGVGISGKRQFTHAIQDGFLDLAIALPWPSSFAPYSSTIILFLLAKKRQWRAEDIVIPALQEAKPLVEKHVLHEMRMEQARGTKEELRGMFSERVKKTMVARRKELFAQHRCHPWPTMLIPPLTQLPLFVGSSLFFSRLAQPPTPLDAETILTLTSLAHPDPAAVVPIALGLITLANVESSRWFIGPAAREQEEVKEKRNAEKRAGGSSFWSRRRFCSLVLGCCPVVLYWISSATFGLLQTWIFDYWESQRSIRRKPGVTLSQSDSPHGSAPTRDGLAAAPTSMPKQKRR